MGVSTLILPLGKLGSNHLVYQKHTSGIRNHSKHVCRQTTIQCPDTFLCNDEFKGLYQPGIFLDIVDGRLTESGTNNFVGVGDEGCDCFCGSGGSYNRGCVG